jgi:hypothetical protein
LPGDAGFGERLLPVAEKLDQTTMLEKEKVSGVDQALLLGESAAIWDETHQRSFTKVRFQSRTLCNWASNA